MSGGEVGGAPTADSTVEMRLLGVEDLDLVLRSKRVFDHTPRPVRAREFFEDPGHLLFGALVDAELIGFASAVLLRHPDKRPEVYLNEVGVRTEFRRLGIATRLMELVRETARERGCTKVWLLTERANDPANQLYRSIGGKEFEEGPVLWEFEPGSGG